LPIIASMPNNGNLLDAALAYSRRGWSIIPTIGKRAAGLWRPFQDRPANERNLRRMFARPDVTGLAVIVGKVSGCLACRDFDQAAPYHRWRDQHPDLARTLPTVQTARGYHVYFRGPEGFTDLGDGEYRANSGHYCLLPPSYHPEGVHYHWTVSLYEGELPIVDPLTAGLILNQTQETQAKTQATHDTHCMCPLMMVEAAILATLPTGPGQRNRLLFQLARRLKSILPDASEEELRNVVWEWHTRALPRITTKDFSVSWEDFRLAWLNVKAPTGAAWSEIVGMVQLPDAQPIDRLIALCRALQRHHGPDKAWPLSCRKAAEVIGVPFQRAARLLKLLQLQGFIELAKTAGPKGSRRAAEYRFLGAKA